MKIAEVRVNVLTSGLDKNFSYRVPDGLNFLSAGWRVVVSVAIDVAVNFALKNISEAVQ